MNGTNGFDDDNACMSLRAMINPMSSDEHRSIFFKTGVLFLFVE